MFIAIYYHKPFVCIQIFLQGFGKNLLKNHKETGLLIFEKHDYIYLMQKDERIKFKGTATDFEQELESMRFH